MLDRSSSSVSAGLQSTQSPQSVQHTIFVVFQMRGDIEHAQEALLAYQATEGSVERSKKHYFQSVAEAIRTKVKLEKLKVEASTNPKAKQRLAEVSWTLGLTVNLVKLGL